MLIGTYQLKLNSKCTFEKVQRILHFPLLMSESKYISVDLVCVDWSSLVLLTINISSVFFQTGICQCFSPTPAAWSILSLHCCHKSTPQPLLTSHLLPVTSHSWEGWHRAKQNGLRPRTNLQQPRQDVEALLWEMQRLWEEWVCVGGSTCLSLLVRLVAGCRARSQCQLCSHCSFPPLQLPLFTNPQPYLPPL